jgi:hypothetical protein
VNGSHPLLVYANEARHWQLQVIPVTGLDRDRHYQSAVASIYSDDRYGICTRLYRDELRRPSFKDDLLNLLSGLGIGPGQADLIIDLQLVDDSSPAPAFGYICDQIPYLPLWRTFTIVSGTFPPDLHELEKNRQHEIPRTDWQTWYSELVSLPPLPRLPTYGDYTIQHPHFSEPVKNANVSASIRYTSDNHWVIMRGEGLRNEGGPGYKQYQANAQLLCERPEFCGAGFSEGDRYIEELSMGIGGMGNPEMLLWAGINHHITFVVNQITTLFGASTGNTPSREAIRDQIR